MANAKNAEATKILKISQAGQKGRRRMSKPKPFTDEELKEIRSPVFNATDAFRKGSNLNTSWMRFLATIDKLENEIAGYEQHLHPECTCYEITGGHQMGCYYYGLKTCKECGRQYRPKESP